MKAKLPVLLFLLILMAILVISGCYTDTVSSMTSFAFQIPIQFHANTYDKKVPATSLVFNNLNKYKEYKDNIEKIKKAEVVQINYWIDSLEFADGRAFDPKKDNVIFTSIKYFLRFAKPKDPDNWNPDDTVADNYVVDTLSKQFELGNFENVNVKDFYKNPHHIVMVPQTDASVISEYIKTNPTFFVLTEYSKIKGQVTDSVKFKLINTRMDLVIRVRTEL